MRELIQYGDPEPPRTATLIDRHGDAWTFRGHAWHTPETAPFAWPDMRRAWFPMEVAK